MASNNVSVESKTPIDGDDRFSKFPILVAAVTPVLARLIAPDLSATTLGVLDGITWLVFLGDYLIRLSMIPKYVLTGLGLFDLSILIATFPWLLLDPETTIQSLAVLRLARCMRLFRSLQIGSAARLLWDRIGNLTAIVVVTVITTAIIVVRSEPTDSGYETFGDGLWWAIVSLTTVGYGDLAPVTPIGRLAGITLMLVGLGTLGTVAASIASFLGNAEERSHEASNVRLMEEIKALRSQMDEITKRIR